jgi:hypothetical protein
VESTDSDCGGHTDGVAESKEKEKQSPARPSAGGIFEQDVEDPEPEGFERRRNFSTFPMLDTISEQKSMDSEEEDEEEEDDEELTDGYSTDDELEYEYGRPFYYEYASPTQPLHPARSRSAPPRGGVPSLYRVRASDIWNALGSGWSDRGGGGNPPWQQLLVLI